jgi:hypothetical protein
MVATKTERGGYFFILDRRSLRKDSRAVISCENVVNLFKVLDRSDFMAQDYQ